MNWFIIIVTAVILFLEAEFGVQLPASLKAEILGISTGPSLLDSDQTQAVVDLPQDMGSLISSSSATAYQVVKVVDGDTIKVATAGAVVTVRLVGINTPESVDPRKPVECLGREAAAYLQEKLSGKSVFLEPDSTQPNQDRYGRWLRFVFLPTGGDVGLDLIKAGFAQEALYSSQSHRYREQYLAAQAEAKQLGRGLWAPEVCPQQ